jgi:pimeloyl-ACP methyl ester carboxylesterase
MHVLPYTMPRSMLRANLAIAYADQAKLTDATVQRTYDMMLTSGVRSVNVARMEQVVLPGIGHVPQEEAPQETIIPLRDFLAR